MNAKSFSAFLVPVLTLAFGNAYAAPETITITQVKGSESDQHFVRITRGDMFKFQLCENVNPDNCISIGRSVGYTREELVTARKAMKREVLIKRIGAGALITVGAVGGWAVGGLTVIAASIPIALGAGGSIAGGTTVAVLTTTTIAGGASGFGASVVFKLTGHATALAKRSLDVALDSTRPELTIKNLHGFLGLGHPYKSVADYVASLTLALANLEKVEIKHQKQHRTLN